MDQLVVMIDEAGRRLGAVEKLQAHVAPVPHRAVSILLFSPRGQLLLQRRAAGKYHSANLWSNSCCSHPRIDEDDADAASRRLREEMGIRSPLSALGSVRYRGRRGRRPGRGRTHRALRRRVDRPSASRRSRGLGVVLARLRHPARVAPPHAPELHRLAARSWWRPPWPSPCSGRSWSPRGCAASPALGPATPPCASRAPPPARPCTSSAATSDGRGSRHDDAPSSALGLA